MRKVALCLTTLLLVFISLFVMVSCGEDPFFHDVKVLDPDGKEVEGFGGVAFYDDAFRLPTLRDIDPDGTKRPEGKILAYRMDGKELDINAESVKISKAVTIEAYWTDGFYITYDSNNDTGETKLYAVNSGDEVKLNDGTLFTMKDRKIGSWNTAKDASGTKYELSSSYKGTKDITLYAKWRQIDDVVVTYDANGASEGTAPAASDGFDPDETNITIADSGTLRKTGMTFIGWNTKADGSGTTYQPGSVYKGSVSLTLYAQWATGYSITYHYMNSSRKDVTYVEVTEFGKAPVYASLPSDAASGYVLDAWYEESTVSEDTVYHLAGETAAAALTGNIDLYGALYDEDVDFEEVSGGYSVKISSKGKAKTEDYTVEIPSCYHGKKVVEVSKDGFYSGSDGSGYPIAGVTIPDTVTTIGENAFRATKLSAVTIPTEVTTIGTGAFSGVSKLTAVTFKGTKLTKIADLTFAATAITAIDIPEGVTELGTAVFGNCKMLEKVSLPSTLVTIGGTCFHTCGKLKSIVIPQKVTSVGSGVFNNCTSLAKVRVKGTEDSISNYAQWGVDTSRITWALYAAGDTGEAGGIIAYVNPSPATGDWLYIEAAPADLEGTYQWGSDGAYSTLSDIGKGKSNTEALLAKAKADSALSFPAAEACDSYTNTYDGKTWDDWFLPSEKELLELITCKIICPNGYSYPAENYWSSSECTTANTSLDSGGYEQRARFVNGNTYALALYRTNEYQVRPVRYGGKSN